MVIRAYIVEHDIGFAPNPFFGVCTVACCKPVIRRVAEIGDWLVGIGSEGDGVRGKLVYAMEVQDRKTLEEYWNAAEFKLKRPNFNGSLMQAQGDNIYRKDEGGHWIQERSRHTHSDPAKTRRHIEHDTQTDCVLISRRFVYLGQNAIDIPEDFVDHRGVSLNLDARGTKRGHPRRESKFTDPALQNRFLSWLDDQGLWGYRGDPNEWQKEARIRDMLSQC